ncbi:MAG: glycosyltransferase family 4 protein [Bacteroidetes bacterium]|nr:glycosyltransferase family 4 protein [Bacteroidota bacterium]
MKILVNTRLLLKNKLEGIGWFSFETLKRITQQHPEHEFIFAFDREFDQEFIFSDNISPIILKPQARHPFLFYLWFEHAIAKALKKSKADLFLSPDGFLSLSTKTKSLGVIHDINFEHYPKDLPWIITKYYQHYFPKFAQKADRIATVSEFSKMDICEKYNINPQKIDVVYNGANEIFKPISDQEKQETKKKYSKNEDYFIYVGALHARKNLVNLFKAFDKYRYSNNTKVNLLIVGEKKWWTPEINAAYENLCFKEKVIFTGRLQSDELAKVMASALALTYVSYFEGFGIPIIEAFNSGVPVITSNVTSMPEVAKDAALLVNPFSVESIESAMKSITYDENLRKSLIEKGNLRKLDFSWQKSADALWSSVLKTIEQ